MRNVTDESSKEFMLGMLLESLSGRTPNETIPAQEKRGQQSFVRSDTLPKDGLDRAALETFGVTFGADADDLFVFCTLPDGWRKVPTDHSMWSKLVDEKGRERASIFYKAAFYDRSAHMSLSRRYSISVDPVGGWSNSRNDCEWYCVAKDGDQVIWQSLPIAAEPEYEGRDDTKRQAWLDWMAKKDDLGELGAAWLDTNYPDWRSPVAYWDGE